MTKNVNTLVAHRHRWYICFPQNEAASLAYLHRFNM